MPVTGSDLLTHFELPTLYQQQIHQSKYARWNEEKKRRETWKETVDRYIDFLFDHAAAQHGFVDDELRELCRGYVLKQDVLGSMRALMTAGPALARDHVAAYNCSYLEVNSPRAFWEAMYILMCGTGVGFSVENRAVSRLPAVPNLTKTNRVIQVEDSKIGWAEVLRQLLTDLWSGKIPSWDLSEIRPAGSILKTFGGRASGPGPLDDLLHFVVELFTNAQGRKLKRIECHAIMCKIGEIVVVGGVRRAALISLSDFSDLEMREAKHGKWWVNSPHFALSNNSVVWETKPSRENFDIEWNALVASGSGERGIFNREAAKTKASETGRREFNREYGLNPCVTGDTWVLTSSGPRQVVDLVNETHETIVNGEQFLTTSDGFWHSGNKEVFHVATKEGYQLRLTGDHKVMTPQGWKKTNELKADDEICIHNHREFVGWPGNGSFDEGCLLGELVGDGNFSGNAAQLKFWGETQDVMLEHALEAINSTVGSKFDLKGTKGEIHYMAQSTRVAELANIYGIVDGKKVPTAEVEKGSSAFVRGFLRGMFDADGSVQGNQIKGISVRVSQSNLESLRSIQRMLLRLGIKSSIYEERRSAGYRPMPNGQGGLEDYWCEASHELIISNDSIFAFRDRVGFYEPLKKEKLDELLGSYQRTPNKTKFTARVKSILPDGIEPVYDCSVPGPNAFDANGIYVANCGEVLLRDREFCNLSQVTIRPYVEFEELREQVKVASVLGTLQSTFTKFRYLSDEWKKNCDEERLLGVGMTGVMEHDVLNGNSGRNELIHWLKELKNESVSTNKAIAKRLKIKDSAAVTLMKPAGNSTQLVGAQGSGMHPAHSKFLIRRNRANKTDPVAQVLYYSGVPCEDEINSPNTTWVFNWPMKVTNGTVVREDRTAIQMLEFWLIYSEHWCEHNPSMTINVRSEEWEEVADWVYNHLDKMVGVSFLPYSDHTYQQAPYEEITEDQYEILKAEMPESIDWSMLQHLETEDRTEGVQELACVSGTCDLV